MRLFMIDTIWSAVNRRLEALHAKPATAGELMDARASDKTVDPDEIVGRIQATRFFAEVAAVHADVALIPGHPYASTAGGR